MLGHGGGAHNWISKLFIFKMSFAHKGVYGNSQFCNQSAALSHKGNYHMKLLWFLHNFIFILIFFFLGVGGVKVLALIIFFFFINFILNGQIIINIKIWLVLC